MRSLPGATVLHGHARFVDAHTVRVGDDTLAADRIFINVGGRPLVPKMPGVDRLPYLTSETMMDVDYLPEHLLVVGGSYIGLEFGQMFRRFGSRVTIVEMAPRLIGREDADVSEAVKDIVAAEGIDVRVDARCLALEPDDQGIAVTLDCIEGAPRVAGTHVLLAVGRVPNTDDLGLREAGIDTDERGYIKVDEQLRTSAPGVYALGDCNGRGAFTHTSYNDYEIVADNLLEGAQRKVSDRIPIYALFIDPPLGTRRHDRRRGATRGPLRVDGEAPDDADRARDRKGRDAGLHEDRRGCQEQAHSRRRRCWAWTATRSCTRWSMRCMRAFPTPTCSARCASIPP
jgi:pyruvate/2-oxoglutarate dehydrogenase complex dihydrolipoamide dehydrogenase (E3) component